MFIRFAVFLCEHSPLLRRLLWRWWYGRLAKKFTDGHWTFMNYGWVPAEGTSLKLEPADEADRLCIQLYHRVVSPLKLAGAHVLEVGSGRGGGASFLARYHQPQAMTGADFSPQAVALCRDFHRAVPNLKFVVGDAERLPFPDATFDAVVNVESSHCYGQVEQFFSEVARVLKPGGSFLYTDFRAVDGMKILESTLASETRWSLIEREDITAGVVAALEADHTRKQALIRELVPPSFQPVFGEFAGLVGGQMHTHFRDRTTLYHRFAFRRK